MTKRSDNTVECSACWHAEHPLSPISDCLDECPNCGWQGSASYMHICRGVRECEFCNEAAKKA